LGPGGERRRQEVPMTDNGTLEPTAPDTIVLVHGYGAAGVAIDSVLAEGVRVTPVSQIRSLSRS
jgi:hypothetical protein